MRHGSSEHQWFHYKFGCILSLWTFALPIGVSVGSHLDDWFRAKVVFAIVGVSTVVFLTLTWAVLRQPLDADGQLGYVKDDDAHDKEVLELSPIVNVVG